MTGPLPPRHAVTRRTFSVRRRVARVVAVESPTPGVRRISVVSPEFADFESPSPDDHVKVFVPDGRGGEVMRDFTPRRFDAAGRRLTLDFALGHDGPAARWAAAASVGDRLDIGGPRGSTLVPDDYDWELLIGDESAFPAIARRVETRRPGLPVATFVTIPDAAERQVLSTSAVWRRAWVVRGPPSERDAAELLAALRSFPFPRGDGFVWVAGETDLVAAVRAFVLEERGHPSAHLHARSYWRRGATAEALGHEGRGPGAHRGRPG